MNAESAVAWESFVQEVVTLWTSGQHEEAFLRVGSTARQAAEPSPDDPSTPAGGPDSPEGAPPLWLTQDGALHRLGEPARAAWLLTAYALLGDALGLLPKHVELALARARTAAVLSSTSLRREAAVFRVELGETQVEALLPLLLRRTRTALLSADGASTEACLAELLESFPEAVHDPGWATLEKLAYEVVSAEMQAGHEVRADAVSAALARTMARQDEPVRNGAPALRAVRGAFLVWLAERRFGTERHTEALSALDAAEAVYAQVPTVLDVPRSQIARLRGEDLRRNGHPERAVAPLSEALRALLELHPEARGLIQRSLRALSDVLLELHRYDEAEAMLRHTLDVVRERRQDPALLTAVRGVVAVDLARITLEHAKADRRGLVRERLTELHGHLVALPPLADEDAVGLLRLIGTLHERLNEHAAALGCYQAALSRIGPRRLAFGALFGRLSLQYGNALFNTGDFDGLDAFVRETGEALADEAPGDPRVTQWATAAAAMLGDMERFSAAMSPDARHPTPGALPALAADVLATCTTPTPPPAVASRSLPPGASLDELIALAARWLNPITAAAPVGIDTRYDTETQELEQRIAQLDAQGGDPEATRRVWRSVEASCDELLVFRTKDLTPAVYLAHAWHQTEGIVGLVRGLALVTGLLERYGDTMFPDPNRPRRRINLLAWLIARSHRTLGLSPAAPSEAPYLRHALRLIERLSAAAQPLLGPEAFAPLRGALERRALETEPPRPPIHLDTVH